MKMTDKGGKNRHAKLGLYFHFGFQNQISAITKLCTCTSLSRIIISYFLTLGAIWQAKVRMRVL